MQGARRLPEAAQAVVVSARCQSSSVGLGVPPQGSLPPLCRDAQQGAGTGVMPDWAPGAGPTPAGPTATRSRSCSTTLSPFLSCFSPNGPFCPHFGAELGPKLWFPGVARDTHPPAGLPKAWLCLSSSSCPAPGRCWSHLRRTTGGWSQAWWPGLAPGGEGQPEVGLLSGAWFAFRLLLCC